jgi:hypothetical protein
MTYAVNSKIINYCKCHISQRAKSWMNKWLEQSWWWHLLRSNQQHLLELLNKFDFEMKVKFLKLEEENRKLTEEIRN